MKFKYKGKIYAPVHLEKKLKKLGVTINDIEIIEYDEDVTQKPKELEDITRYFFNNLKTGEVIISIYNNLDHLIYDNILKTGIKGFDIKEWIMNEN